MATLQRCHLRILLKVSSYRSDSHCLRHIGQKTGRQVGTKNGSRWKKRSEADRKLDNRSLLLRPFGFTVLVGGTSFAGCAIWQYESLRTIVKEMSSGKRRDNNQFVGKAGTFRDHVNYYGNSLTAGKKVLLGIIGINVAVFSAWRVSALRNVMLTYFVSSPFGKAPCWSMLFSNWSHYSFAHIFVNMYVLWSFSGVTDQLGKEQFIAFYSTAGVVSALTGYLVKTARMRNVVSLGASGAVMALIGFTGVQYPESRMSIAFVDQMLPHSFSIGTAVLAVICFDVLGLVLGWKLLDHAGHLGGMMFGIWYGKYGRKWIWEKREGFVKMWHGIRGKP